ncbi:MAG: DUF2293 domain-containing protein [Chloroflexota bacterium]
MADAAKPKHEDIAVFWSRRESECDECGRELGRGSFLKLEEGKAYCMDCADLEHLWFLPRGDTALTRRARKHSRLSAVVLQWSRSRRRYERQGLLVEATALAQAEEECLADADLREARRERAADERARWDEHFMVDFASAIQDRLPGCPEDDAVKVARRACERSSGRVGRTEAGRALSAETIELAVRAHIRHQHTPYDDYLMDGWDRGRARDEVRPVVDEVMERWSR